MNIRNYAGFGFTKGLIVLCIALQISGCSEEDVNLGTKTVQLTWIAPVERANGDPLSPSEIGGYRVYYGKTAGNYPNQLDINDGTADQTTLTVPLGVYFIIMTTYDVDGRESAFSAENKITI